MFLKDEQGDIFHTYSTYARGLDTFLTAYQYMDVTPKGAMKPRRPAWAGFATMTGTTVAFVDPWAEKPGVTGPLPA